MLIDPGSSGACVVRGDKAEKLNQQVMETCRNILRIDHLDTLISIANLALIYRNQGRWEAAEKLDMQALVGLNLKLGADHPEILIRMSNLP